MKETPGDRLKRALDRAGLKNGPVAEAAGVTAETVSRWRSNSSRQHPGETELDVIVALLAQHGVDVTPAWIRYGEQQPYSPQTTARSSQPTAPVSSGVDSAYPRHLEGAVKRLEAEIEESPVDEDTRASLIHLLRNPALATRYRMGFESGEETAAEQATYLESHLAKVRGLLEDMVAALHTERRR